MPAARLDHDGSLRLERDDLSVQFQSPLALQDEVDLGHFLVIMQLAVFLDLHHMQRGQVIVIRHEGSTGITTGTTGGFNLSKLGNKVILHPDTSWPGVGMLTNHKILLARKGVTI